MNNHFNNSENSSSSKRSSDPPAPKVLKNKINKKLKYRLTPWSGEFYNVFGFIYFDQFLDKFLIYFEFGVREL